MIKVHVTLHEEIPLSIVLKELASLNAEDFNTKRYEKYGVASFDIQEENIAALKNISWVKSVEIDQARELK